MCTFYLGFDYLYSSGTRHESLEGEVVSGIDVDFMEFDDTMRAPLDDFQTSQESSFSHFNTLHHSSTHTFNGKDQYKLIG